MQIHSVGTKLYTYKANSNQKAVQNPMPFQTDGKEKENKDKKKKIIIGASVTAIAILLLILFRKNIKNLFKRKQNSGNSGDSGGAGSSEGANKPHGHNSHHPDPKHPESPKQHDNPKPPENPNPPKNIVQAEEVEIQTETFNAQVMMKEYRELCAIQKDPYTLKTEEEKQIWKEQNNKIRELYKKLRTNNISFVVKEEFDPNPLVDRDKKREYLYSWKVADAYANEASKMDFLEMYEKYGERYYDPKEPWNSSLSIITSIITSNGPTSDTVLKQYINIMDKLAIKDPKGLQDAVIINFALEKNIDSMSEDTVLKFIEVMKKTGFEQREGKTVETAITFSPHKDNPKIKAALDDFIDSLKDYPYEVQVDDSVFL